MIEKHRSGPPTSHDPSTLVWRLSSFTGSGSDCVEVADAGDLIAVRNSHYRDAGTLWFTRAEMAAWVLGCQAGEFDDLAQP